VARVWLSPLKPDFFHRIDTTERVDWSEERRVVPASTLDGSCELRTAFLVSLILARFRHREVDVPVVP